MRFALQLLGVTGLFAGLAGILGVPLWFDLTAAERDLLRALLAERAPLLTVLGLLLVVSLGMLLRAWRAAYPLAARRLEEAIGIIQRVNPQHRVTIGGAKPMRRLGHVLNTFAEAYFAQRQDIEGRIAETNARLKQEKNRLAALMSELAESVLVCTVEGRILLYNPQASQLLEGRETGTVGLGRSVFGILDQRLIEHGLDKLRHCLDIGISPSAHFVTTRAGLLLRGRMAPVLDPQGGMLGFVLIIEDVTRNVDLASRREHLLRQLSEGSRSALANIRAAAETLQQYPDMDAEHRQRFGEVIRDEAERLSLRLEQSQAREDELPGGQWPLEDMLASDLVVALQRSLSGTLGLKVRCRDCAEPLWLSVDSYSLVQGLTQLMDALVPICGIRDLSLELSASGRFARLALCWGGQVLDPGLLHQWEERPLNLGSADPAGRSIKELLERHGGELWSQADRASGRNRLCLQLPTTQPLVAPSALPGRPVYYDFDLFNQPGQTAELDDRPLSELAYTVFDTETTGLSPSEGDEIISIGALRVVNGRLLQQERFDRLINPRRPIRRESQQIHGLTEQMLADQPGIEDVLPAFHRFAEDTVLVAHNAAFDMRFLQLKEARTGVRFIQPVLDTLLLSALVHPAHGDDAHRLERIAERLGVTVVGRHTALGDAQVTGEVLLKLIPLLAEQGIHTLGQAREASRRTQYAKLKY
jgi:DNA polymerase-3 subunit epsilon